MISSSFSIIPAIVLWSYGKYFKMMYTVQCTRMSYGHWEGYCTVQPTFSFFSLFPISLPGFEMFFRVWRAGLEISNPQDSSTLPFSYYILHCYNLSC